MTDPLKTYLRPLDEGEPNAQLLERARSGTSRSLDRKDLHSTAWTRIGVAAIAIVVFIAAGAFAWKAFSPPSSAVPENGAGVFMAVDPTTPNVHLDALSTSPVVVRDGCVLFGQGGYLSLPIWPKGFTADHDADGNLVIKDASGAVVAVEGQPLRMGGGYVAEFKPADKVEPKATQVTRVEDALGYQIPDRCLVGIGGIWQVGQIESASTQSPADQLTVTCTSDGVRLAGTIVAPHQDGVRVDSSNPGGAASIEFHPVNAPDGQTFGARATGSGTTPMSPGTWEIACLQNPSQSYRDVQTATFEVVDPNSYWVAPGLDCESPRTQTVRVVAVQTLTNATRSELQTAAENQLAGVQSTDVFQGAAYGGMDFPMVYWGILIRDGQRIASVKLYSSDGPWTVESCVQDVSAIS